MNIAIIQKINSKNTFFAFVDDREIELTLNDKGELFSDILSKPLNKAIQKTFFQLKKREKEAIIKAFKTSKYNSAPILASAMNYSETTINKVINEYRDRN